MRLETLKYALACALIPSPGTTDEEDPDGDVPPTHPSFSSALPPVGIHLADANTGSTAKINQGI